jgi:predicted RecB family nuclease
MLDDLPQPIKDEILHRINDEDYRNKPNTYSITELLYCIRKSYYRRINPKPIALKSAFNLYRGQIFDNLWCKLFTHNQVRATYRCKNIPITISGRYDFLTTDNVLTDLKTIKNLYFVKEPSPEYVTQIRFYAWLNSIEKAQILYIDFGGCKIFPVEVGDCNQLLIDIENKAQTLYNALKKEQPPTKNCLEWLCKECEYTEECNHA